MKIVILVVVVAAFLHEIPAQHPGSRIVGRMASPTSYAFVHLFREPFQISTIVDMVEDKLVRAVNNFPDPKFRSQFVQMQNDIRKKVKNQRHRLFNLRQEMCQDKREKRSALGVAGAFLGVASIGLGVANRLELESLSNQVADNEQRQDLLIEDIDEHFKMAFHDLRHLTAAFRGMFEMNLNRTFQQQIDTLRVEVFAALTVVDLRIDQWSEATYNALRGILDPTFASPETLEEVMLKIKNKIVIQDMRIVETHYDAEAFFANPITAVRNDSGLHIFIAVPIMPAAMPMLDIIKLDQESVEMNGANGFFINFELDNAFLVIDPQRSVHAQMTATELLACHKYRQIYMCDRQTFERRPNTCLAALMYANKTLAALRCETSISRHNYRVLTQSQNSTTVWSKAPTTVKRVCPNQTVAPLITFEGRKDIDMRHGCYLESDEARTYFSQNFHFDPVEGTSEEWNVALLLGSHPREDYADILNDLDAIKSAQLPMREARKRINRKKSTWTVDRYAMCVVAAIFSILMFLLIMRYMYLARLQRNLKNEEDEEKESQYVKVSSRHA